MAATAFLVGVVIERAWVVVAIARAMCGGPG